MRISNEYTKDTAGSEAVDRPEPQQGLRSQIAEMSASIYGNVGEATADEIIALIEQTLYDCLPEKRSKPDKDASRWAEGVYKGYNEAIGETQDNLKRRMES